MNEIVFNEFCMLAKKIQEAKGGCALRHVEKEFATQLIAQFIEYLTMNLCTNKMVPCSVLGCWTLEREVLTVNCERECPAMGSLYDAP